jgi:hypothetical protein
MDKEQQIDCGSGFYKYRWSLYGCGKKFEAISECDPTDVQKGELGCTGRMPNRSNGRE